jgi:hypothetical protein
VAAGLITSRSAAVILGINNPFVVEVISNAADSSGFSLLIPTWAKVVTVISTAAKSVNNYFISVFYFLFLKDIYFFKTDRLRGTN